jgi:hypothetical protein
MKVQDPSHSLPGPRTRLAHGSTSLNTRFSMNRRDMTKLAVLIRQAGDFGWRG